MRIYIAAPLFNESELASNRELRDLLRGLGADTYLPQEDGGIAYDIVAGGGIAAQTRKQIFEKDAAEIRACDLIVCVLDGRVPDEGVCIEVGMAYVLGKPCVGYLTDKRTLDPYGLNLMIEGCLSATLRSKEELAQYIKNLV
jgi:nucleoside 2-deoxyribosyltransferase